METENQQQNNEMIVCKDGEQALLPQLESLERMMKLPVVGATWQQTQDVYGKVKGMYNNSLFFFYRSSTQLDILS